MFKISVSDFEKKIIKNDFFLLKKMMNIAIISKQIFTHQLMGSVDDQNANQLFYF